jgi:hypothetical protein
MRSACILALLAIVFLPVPAPAAEPTPACQRAVARAGAKFTRAALKASQRCAMRAMRGSVAATCRARAGGSTGDAVADASIARAIRRLGVRVGRACARSDLSIFSRRCHDPSGPPLSLAELLACLRDTHLDRVGAMVAVEFPGLALRTAHVDGQCDSPQICECRCASASGSFLVPLTGDVL